MKFTYHIRPLQIVVIVILASATLGIPIENKGEQDELFSIALKNSAGVADSNTGNDNNMRYLRQFVGRLLRALSSTLKNYPTSPLSQIASTFDENAEQRTQRRQDRIQAATFRFPEESPSETREQPQLEPPSSRTARLAFDENRFPSVRTGPDGRPIRMGTVERVVRPSLGTNEKQQGTNFDIPWSASVNSPAAAPSSRFDPAASKLVTAATSQSQITSSMSRLNDTREIKYGKPSTIQSQPLYVTDGPRDGKRGRSLKTIDVQGVKIIVGERVPDSPEDKFFTWRNARVIKGHLVPNDNAESTGFLNDNWNSRSRSKLLQ